MRIEDIEYTFGGSRMVGHLAVDGGRPGTRPGVLVCHEGPGLDEHAKRRAESLAGLGYAAFALDYHGEGKPLERDEMMGRLGALMAEPDRIRELAGAGLAILLAQEEVDRTRMAAIGYCFGGTMALELARNGAELAAVVASIPASGLNVLPAAATSKPASWYASGPTIRWSRPSSERRLRQRCGLRTSTGV